MATPALTKKIIFDTGGKKNIDVPNNVHIIHVQMLSENNDVVVNVAANSQYTNFVVANKKINSKLNVHLTNKRAKTELFGLFVPTEKITINTEVNHLNDECDSVQEYRYILCSDTNNEFNPALYINPNFENNRATQFCRATLLTEKAQLLTKPSLKIANDKVECSHGIAIGKLDQKSIEYLCNRGLHKSVAELMLVHSFANYIISKLPKAEYRKQALKILQDSLTS